MIFKQKRKTLKHEIKIDWNRKRLYPTPILKYLGVKIYENLNWHHHIKDLAKADKENMLLFKIRNDVS